MNHRQLQQDTILQLHKQDRRGFAPTPSLRPAETRWLYLCRDGGRTEERGAPRRLQLGGGGASCFRVTGQEEAASWGRRPIKTFYLKGEEWREREWRTRCGTDSTALCVCGRRTSSPPVLASSSVKKRFHAEDKMHAHCNDSNSSQEFSFLVRCITSRAENRLQQ